MQTRRTCKLHKNGPGLVHAVRMQYPLRYRAVPYVSKMTRIYTFLAWTLLANMAEHSIITITIILNLKYLHVSILHLKT